MSSAASSDNNSGRNRILVSVYQMREQYIHIIQFNIDSRSRSRSDDRSQCNMQIENTSSIYDSVFADGDGFVNLCAWGRAKITGFINGAASVCWLTYEFKFLSSQHITQHTQNTIFYTNN